MLNAIIVDLDNTLFDSRCMDKYLPKDLNSREEWDEFHKHYHECVVNSDMYHLISLLAIDHVLLFVTSRENKPVVAEHILPVILNLFPYAQKALYLRETNDYRLSDIVKEEIYKNYIQPKFNVICAFDDDESVIKMWQRNGIITYQRRFGYATGGVVPKEMFQDKPLVNMKVEE